MPMVIGKEQAETVFNRYAWERRDAVARRDREALAAVETGPLLAENQAWVDLLKARAGWAGWVDSFGRPEFLIPAEKDQQGHPRSFAVLSREFAGSGKSRASAVHYFVQEAPGGEWKAAAMSWVNDRAAAPDPARTNEVGGFRLRDKEIAAPVRDAAGVVTLSPTAAADREVCGKYAKYMSFSLPDGEPVSEHFVPGVLTGGVVGDYNRLGEGLELVDKRVSFEAAGGELPVVRLADGKSLVTCTFVRTDFWEGRKATFKYGSTDLGDVGAVIGGMDKWWRDSTVRRSVTVSFEVPAGGGPADVVGSNAHVARVLSAEGTPK
ncbi:hypothetical protein ACIGFK_36095 [Streptomyces sp. NPDC085524]|uniref:hypothetical protein n=1 Tax=Streptomyces sp. NPDC085524 TaxID=3365728 RepID=UPI0037D25CD9